VVGVRVAARAVCALALGGLIVGCSTPAASTPTASSPAASSPAASSPAPAPNPVGFPPPPQRMFWEIWTVSGHHMQILTAHIVHIYGPAYRAVYYDTHDTPGAVTCTAACAKRWPPLLESDLHLGMVRLRAGALSFFDGPDGRQAEYDGHPLYLYAGDSASPMAQGTGNAADGTWFVVTPGLRPAR
jgi:Secreted repeat of unknown function